MNDIYAFIKKGLDDYNSLNIPDFTTDVLKNCIILNELLNKNIDSDYVKHLENNIYGIEESISNLFRLFSNNLYLNLAEVFNLLKIYQEDKRIGKEKYRDHYFHSIQCFLLGLSIYAQVPFLSTHRVQNQHHLLTTSFFSLFIYHDLGYLYFCEDSDRINNTIKTWIHNIETSDNQPYENNRVMRIRKILNISLNEAYISELSKGDELNKIWEKPINYTDGCIIKEVFGIRNKPTDLESHHSYESAVLLYRFIKTLDYFSINSTTKDSIVHSNESKNKFIKIIEAILLRDFNIYSKISFEDNFFACLLMIVDELQNYGRPYQDDTYNSNIILPTKVGFEFSLESKIRLIKDDSFIGSLKGTAKEKYDKYSTKNIFNTLKVKNP